MIFKCYFISFITIKSIKSAETRVNDQIQLNDDAKKQIIEEEDNEGVSYEQKFLNFCLCEDCVIRNVIQNVIRKQPTSNNAFVSFMSKTNIGETPLVEETKGADNNEHPEQEKILWSNDLPGGNTMDRNYSPNETIKSLSYQTNPNKNLLIVEKNGTIQEVALIDDSLEKGEQVIVKLNNENIGWNPGNFEPNVDIQEIQSNIVANTQSNLSDLGALKAPYTKNANNSNSNHRASNRFRCKKCDNCLNRCSRFCKCDSCHGCTDIIGACDDCSEAVGHCLCNNEIITGYCETIINCFSQSANACCETLGHSAEIVGTCFGGCGEAICSCCGNCLQCGAICCEVCLAGLGGGD